MNLIGIDLGTTTSEVAIYRYGEPEIIKNIKEGDTSIIPSVVLIEENKVIIGTKAKNQMILKPKNVISEIKRLMGSNKKIKVDNKIYSPVDVSSMILKKLKEVAEFYLGEEVDEAVITVPANFNNKARKETKEAAEKIGLKVNRIINEPTAAAIAYGINNEKENINILVYDFGGGTIDVTVLELFEGVLDVKASRGNNEIGGKDIDKEIMKYLIRRFKSETGESLDLKDLRTVSALKKASEECKISLATNREWDVILPYIGKDKNGNSLDMNITIDRKILKGLSKNIINETEKIIHEALEGADVSFEEIDKVILVGGSTRLIDVKELIERKFGKEKIVAGINPEETVALGAAIQCAIKNKKESKGIVVTDICSHTLGVEVLGGKFDPIIERDSKLPAQVTKLYKTAEDYQTEANINIYQGENNLIQENVFIGQVEIKDIPIKQKGEEVIEITFKYDLNGMLDTKVKVLSTGEEEKRKFNGGQEIDNKEEKDEIEKVDNLKEMEKLEIEDELENSDDRIIEDNIEASREEIKEKEHGEKVEIKKEVENREKIKKEVENKEKVKKEFESKGDIENKEEVTDRSVEENIKETKKMESKEEIEKDEEIENKGNIKEVEKESIDEMEKEDIEEEEDEDYSNIYGEIVNVVNYANSQMEDLDKEVQSEIRELLRDLLTELNNSKFKECRDIERKILKLVGIE